MFSTATPLSRFRFSFTGGTRAVFNVLPVVLLVIGAVALAVEPAAWLIRTWYAPGYEGTGVLAAVLTGAIATWSLSTPNQAHVSRASLWGTGLLLGTTSLVRLAAQILDINVIGALILCVDVFALARLFNLHRRSRRVSPAWLAMLFAFSLPVEPMLQRVAGYPLQLMSAEIGCALLGLGFQDLACSGVRLTLNAQDIFVDLPCSGSELLSLSAMLLAATHALWPARSGLGTLNVIAWLTLALAGNGVRIALLALGIVHADAIGVDVMAQPWHDLIGLGVVGAVNLTLYALIRRLGQPRRPVQTDHAFLPSTAHPRSPVPVPGPVPVPVPVPGRISLLPTALFAIFALSVSAIQPQPVDASLPMVPPQAPWVVAGLSATSGTMTDQEQHYFSRYGGGASRTAYGHYGLMLVTTASPLRHLHDPTICLTGAGFDVHLKGTDHTLQTTVYRAVHPEQGDFDVYVTYLSSAGHQASSIAEVVWRWFGAPQERWTMVQSIVPAGMTALEEATAWRTGIQRAFNLNPGAPA